MAQWTSLRHTLAATAHALFRGQRNDRGRVRGVVSIPFDSLGPDDPPDIDWRKKADRHVRGIPHAFRIAPPKEYSPKNTFSFLSQFLRGRVSRDCRNAVSGQTRPCATGDPAGGTASNPNT